MGDPKYFLLSHVLVLFEEGLQLIFKNKKILKQTEQNKEKQPPEVPESHIII